MAFTASWIAAFVLEFVELDVLDSPRSWLIDSVLELPARLDRSELTELVLILFSLAPRRRTAQAMERPIAILSANREFP
jgi:hypothetical protein